MTKRSTKKRQRTYWAITHKYPNGFFKAGIVNNSNWGESCDVIAYHEHFKTPYGQELDSQRHLSVDEALNMIHALAGAVSYYVENKKKKEL